MTVLPRQCLVGLAVAILTAACSPALNWRTVSLEGLDGLLPCKPDHAERRVQLGVVDTALRMSGCEASGALYAISHVRVEDPAQREASKRAWRQATFSTLQADVGTAVPHPADRQQGKMTPNPEQIEGRRPDGSLVQAQIVWLSKGADIYQVAVYASKLDKEKTELLFSELRL